MFENVVKSCVKQEIILSSELCIVSTYLCTECELSCLLVMWLVHHVNEIKHYFGAFNLMFRQ